MWREEDPRWSINKRDKIVIFDFALNKVYTANVETKNAFCIWIDFNDKPFISADDEWPKSWVWDYLPNKNDIIKKKKEIIPEKKIIDLKNNICIDCFSGTYQETSVQDDVGGVLHCDSCYRKVNRYEEK